MARSASAPGFAPTDRPRIEVAADGTVAAIHEATRVVVVELPSCTPFAELGTDGEASATEVAWVGTPPRLLVLSRYAAHSSVHLVDPFGPRTIAEMRLEAPMKLYASVGSYALVVGSLGTAILSATDKSLTPYQFPARTQPVTAGAAGNQFVVALAGTIEEWDPQSRMPKRRLKLPRPATITAVGGSDRVVWMTTQQDPARVDVIPLVNRGQPKAHDLPEPIASVASHPSSDLIACIGATSGRVWVIDLDGRRGLRMVGPEGIDRVEAVGLVLGRVAGVLAAQANRPITVVALDRHDADAPALARDRVPSQPPPAREESPESKRSSLYGDEEEDGTDPGLEEVLTSVTLSSPPVTSPGMPALSPAAPPPTPAPAAQAPTAERTAPTPAVARASTAERTAPTPAVARASTAERTPPAVTPMAERAAAALPAVARAYSAERRIAGQTGPAEALTPPPTGDAARFGDWRDRVRQPRARTAEPALPLWDALPPWREEAVAWARAVAEGRDDQAPASTPFGSLITRFDLSPQLQPVLALLYGTHLDGIDGASPAAVARVLGGNWREALGRGELAEHDVATTRDSRVRLAPAVQRALDELLPATGTVVGAPGFVPLLGPCVIVSTSPLPIVAEACLTSIGGAILAAHPDADPRELVLEARAYGAAPMLRITATTVLDHVPTDTPIILVVDDDATADQLGIPRLI